MHRYDISRDDLISIRSLVESITNKYSTTEDPGFLSVVAAYAHELPRDLREFLVSFRLAEEAAVCVIGGYPVDGHQIGPTPSHWARPVEHSPTLDMDIFLVLCGCILGEPIAWSTQQDGHLVHDVLPIREHAGEQLDSGSRRLLSWRTAEAFHPLRPDYVGLACLRNPGDVETTYASLDGIALPSDVMDILRLPIFPIRPDLGHLPYHRWPAGSQQRSAELTERCYEWMTEIDAHPPRVAVLSGADDRPYLRIDPYYMDLTRVGEAAKNAFRQLSRGIDASIRGYALQAGEILILDNYRAVHGRRAFQARFDGTDRWLRRLSVTRDLRKSRARRVSADSRVIY
ncbi:MAG TPA: guanitoxin biosynthesis L-enduracididine beta-hydroxylase GntD [Streptosporangiaceae bacterium]